MGDYTQLGIAGLTLGILFFIVRYFVSAMNKKDEMLLKQHEELKELTIKGMESTEKFTQAVNLNTQTAKKSADNLTKLILEVIKTNK
jgi:hypothetical protein